MHRNRKGGFGAVASLRRRKADLRGGNLRQELSGGRHHADSLVVLVESYLESLAVRHYSPTTIQGQRQGMGVFCRWATERELERASEITGRMMEGYQRWLHRQVKRNGKPLGGRAQARRLAVVKCFFRWACRHHYLVANPASELEMPREEHRLPAGYLSGEQLERVFAAVDISDPLGVRDRAIIEVLYSTGMRRSELARLEVTDVNLERRTVWVRQGKGKKDRVIPIGRRALGWVERYLLEVRPQLSLANEKTLFVTAYGEGFNVEVLGRTVIRYMRKAGLENGGCHLFRHTCATHMLENGADIRFIC